MCRMRFRASFRGKPGMSPLNPITNHELRVTSRMKEENIKEAIRRICLDMGPALSDYRVILFGSRASGAARERSDFDVGILGASPLPLKLFYEMEDRIDRLETLHWIDLVDLTRASSQFREEALKAVEVLYG